MSRCFLGPRRAVALHDEARAARARLRRLGARLRPRCATSAAPQVSLLSSVLYYALTTGNGTPTLGEEYSDLHAVRRTRPPRQRASAPKDSRALMLRRAGGGRRAAAAVAAATRAADCAAVRGAILAGARAVRRALRSCNATADLRFAAPHSRRALRHPVSADGATEGGTPRTAAADEQRAASGALAGVRNAAAAAVATAADAAARCRTLLRRAMPHMEARCAFASPCTRIEHSLMAFGCNAGAAGAALSRPRGAVLLVRRVLFAGIPPGGRAPRLRGPPARAAAALSHPRHAAPCASGCFRRAVGAQSRRAGAGARRRRRPPRCAAGARFLRVHVRLPLVLTKLALRRRMRPGGPRRWTRWRRAAWPRLRRCLPRVRARRGARCACRRGARPPPRPAATSSAGRASPRGRSPSRSARCAAHPRCRRSWRRYTTCLEQQGRPPGCVLHARRRRRCRRARGV